MPQTTRAGKLVSLLAKACRQRGRKAALARACGVRASQVSEWLAGRAEPDGVALAALDWLMQTEPDAASLYFTTPRPRKIK